MKVRQVVQKRATHRWHDRGDAPATMTVVRIGAHRAADSG